MKKQGVKLFIFIMIAYFYDTHEKQMRRPLDFGIRSADCGMRSAEMGRTLNCEIQNSERGLRGQFQERLGFFFEIFSSAHFTIFSASVLWLRLLLSRSSHPNFQDSEFQQQKEREGRNREKFSIPRIHKQPSHS